MQPVPHVLAGAIDRNADALQGIKNGEGNELLRKLEGSVIVGAIGQDDWKPIAAMPGVD